ncbi:MAG: ribosome maturation factor RimP [Candidatus Aegiribacteria sp.]
MEETDLFELVERLVSEAGLLLVDLSVKNTGRRYMIRLLADRPGRIGINECAKLSRAIQDAMDENLLLLNENYRLEVSSPGIGRPLSTETDWLRTVGRKLTVELEEDGFTDWLEEYSSGLLKFRDGREVASADIVSAVEALE